MTPTPDPGPLLRRHAPPPETIEALSLERIATEAGTLPWIDDDRRMALRLAYAVGDPGILPDLVIAPDAVARGVEALLRGQPIYTDVRMVAAGIDARAAASLGVPVRCLLDLPGVSGEASARGITRSAQAVLAQASALDGAIVAIGNAPTALLALLDLVDVGLARPALVLGFPVGYVAAAESKEELLTRGIPFIALRGRRGGTPLAVAAANTLLRLALAQSSSERTVASLGLTDAFDAILLVGHGSREPEAARSMEAIVRELAPTDPARIVQPCFLQFASPTVPQAVGRCFEQGARQIVAVPYFLHQGLHVLRDLPALLRQASLDYPDVTITVAEPFGSHPSLAGAVLDRAMRGPYLSDIAQAGDATRAAGYVMSAAPFLYREDGRPDWQTMWESFCELALFGGPSHRGSENPIRGAGIDAQPAAGAVNVTFDAIEEIRRGILETCGLRAEAAEPGWLAIPCENERMATWMAATIILEHVDARFDGATLYVPAQPTFTIENEVKSVITVVAKTHHYWAAGHTPSATVAPRDRGVPR